MVSVIMLSLRIKNSLNIKALANFFYSLINTNMNTFITQFLKRGAIVIHIVGISAYSFAQIGISTPSPQQSLHVSGITSSTPIGTTGVNLVKPTVRIEGLNRTNNAVHNSSGNSIKQVFANENGDLVLAASSNLITGGTINDDVPLLTLTTVTPGNTYTGDLKSMTFTLQRKSLVSFASNISTAFYSTSGGILTDGRPHLAQTYWYFSSVPSGSPVPTNAWFGRTGFQYTSSAATNVLNGLDFLNSNNYLSLDAGTYTVVLGALIQSFGPGDVYRVDFAGFTSDNVTIVALPN